MKNTKFIISSIIVALFFASCDKDEEMAKESGMFKVTIENTMIEKKILKSGVFNTPVGATEPGGAGPGNKYEFSFTAGPGSKLSFSTMFVKSNDLFYAPSDDGIALFVDNTAISGDITAQIMLWDAGTEVNEEPGMGANQPLNGGGATGTAENGTVREISLVNDEFTYPTVAENLKVSISNNGNTEFTVTIENLAGSSTPIAPGVWVIHSSANPIFEAGMADTEKGLKKLAESGDPSILANYLEANTGYFSPLAPGVWAIYNAETTSIFDENMADLDEGLENLAENGDPSTLATTLGNKSGIISSGTFSVPSTSSSAGPLLPGSSYTFTVTAEQGAYLNFATMLVHSNDLFYAPSSMGIKLWNGSMPVSGDVTSQIMLWDAGTELNEEPGVGIHQPARLNGGVDENGVVKIVNDGFSYPTINKSIKVTIEVL